MLFLSNTRPLATKSADGTFALTLLAFDRVGPHQVEPWRITWSGAKAAAFYNHHGLTDLKPGTPIYINAEKLRNFTNGHCTGGPEFVVKATHIELAPIAVKRGISPPAACVTSY